MCMHVRPGVLGVVYCILVYVPINENEGTKNESIGISDCVRIVVTSALRQLPPLLFVASGCG